MVREITANENSIDEKSADQKTSESKSAVDDLTLDGDDKEENRDRR